MSLIDDFHVIKLRTTSSSPDHDLFIKEHSIRQKSPDKPSGRTLFVLNIPPYANETNLKSVFNVAGPVENILFAEKSTAPTIAKPETESKVFPTKELFRFKVAFIIFKTPDGLENALQLSKLPALDENKLITGVEKWKRNYIDQFPLDTKEFQNEIDEYMNKYDLVTQKQNDLTNYANQKDEEGWTTVGKKGVHSGFEQKESIVNKLESKIEKGRKKELKNFYTFQIRESKMKNIISLRKKYQQDKQKIENMKKTRTFKPF